MKRVRVFGGLWPLAGRDRKWPFGASIGKIQYQRKIVSPVWKIDSEELLVTTIMVASVVTSVGRWLKYKMRMMGGRLKTENGI